jgi:hypothetical protein
MTGAMTRDELRALQAPIKDRYLEDPDAAQITLEADGTSVRESRAPFKRGGRSHEPGFTRERVGTGPSPARGTCCCRPWPPARG